jgi:hypothetical protein
MAVPSVSFRGRSTMGITALPLRRSETSTVDAADWRDRYPMYPSGSSCAFAMVGK